MIQKNTANTNLDLQTLLNMQVSLKFWLPRSERLQGFYEVDAGILPSLGKTIDALGSLKYRLDLSDKIWTVWVKLDASVHSEQDGNAGIGDGMQSDVNPAFNFKVSSDTRACLNDDWVEVVFREFNFATRTGGSDDEVENYERFFTFGFRDINLVVTSFGEEGDKNNKFSQNVNSPTQYEHEFSDDIKVLNQLLERVLAEIAKLNSQGQEKYLAELNSNLPVKYKFGVIKRDKLWQYLEKGQLLQAAYQEQNLKGTSEFIGKPYPNYPKRMTANEFFKLCEICYDVNNYAHSHYDYFAFSKDLKDDDEKEGDSLENQRELLQKQTSEYAKLTPKQKYQKFADGRDCGLTKIDPDSPEEFEKWLERDSRCGGHPWEIARGGNSTHISLYVSKLEADSGSGEVTREIAQPKYTLTLAGDSMARIEETVRFALELYLRKIPFKLVNMEKIIKALTGEDYIGIVPEDVSPKYAQHYFKSEHEVLHVLNPWQFRESDSEVVEAIIEHGEFYPVQLW